MRAAQRALARFLPLVDWPRFDRRPSRPASGPADGRSVAFASASDTQAVAFLLRTDACTRAGTLRTDAVPLDLSLRIPGLQPGRYRVTRWDTRAGSAVHTADVLHEDGDFVLRADAVVTDAAFAIGRTS
jgi:mannan endo-1,4-beta-mannosidase